MALLVFNKTAAPVTLTGLPITVIVPPSAAPPARGPAVNVTSELAGLTGLQYTNLEAQRATASLDYEWTAEPEYAVGTLAVGGGSVLAALSLVTQTKYVDCNRTDVYVEDGSVVHPYKTIQAAVDAIAALGTAIYHVISIASGIYAESVVLEHLGLRYLKLQGVGYVSINPAAGNALQSVALNSNLQALLLADIGFAKPVVITGPAGPASAFNDVLWERCKFTSTATLSVTCVNNFSMVNTYSECDIAYVNVGWSYIESSQLQGLFNFTMDDTQPIPSSGKDGSLLANGCALLGSASYTIGGTATYTPAVQACRWGANSPLTVPAGVLIYAYSSWLRGTHTNNGSITLRNSNVENYVAGTGTLTFTANPGTQVNFVPVASAASWGGPGAPSSLSDAVDRIAVAVAAGTSGPIA